jgi:hypothetical protein
MQLRTPGFLVDVASQQGFTMAFPVPVELVQLFRPRSAGTGRQPLAKSGESP